ncbi:MAG: hypothetical protein JSS59_10470 [Proteobacteria bacterium]|uniref:hypothetical protein n=1 Tax=Rudaea sp. TaxID=2136325 RepID=UPI003784DB86|nr:hypothetical protein [Pseudomonadota bacterium]
MKGRLPKQGKRSAAAPADAVSPSSPTGGHRLRDWLVGTLGMMAAAPVIGIFTGFLLLFGGIFLGVAWQAAMKPLVDMRQYAGFSASTSGHIVESWAAINFDPASLPAGKLYWDRASKISRCTVVEYNAGDWGTPLRRAFCGMRLQFSDNFRLSDWAEAVQEGIPFTFLRDASGFELQEVRMNRTTLDWISHHPPRDTFMMSKPPPATALAALREQLDLPVDVAVLSWTHAVPDFPLRFDPQRPQEAMPARVVEDSRAWNPTAAVLALLLAIPGFWVWRMGVRVFFPAEPSPLVLWTLTLLPLLALPWWGEMLPKLIARANRDWATIASDMLDDVTRGTRLIASTPDEAEFARGERLVWRLDQGAYAETFGRIRYARPEPPPKSADEAIAALRAQTAAQVRGFDSAQRAALFQRLREQYDANLQNVQRLFTTAAEDTLRDAGVDAAAHKAARKFLFYASGGTYYEDQLDRIEAARDAASAASR